MADGLAKARANLLLPPERVCTELSKRLEARIAFYHGVAAAVATYPRPAEMVENNLARVAEHALPTLVVVHEREQAWLQHR